MPIKFYGCLGEALENQGLFEKRMVPNNFMYNNNNYNNNSLSRRELDNFIIDVEKIDRLYDISYPNEGFRGDKFVLICRLEYEKKKYDESNNIDEEQQQQEQSRQSSSLSFPLFVKMLAYRGFAPGSGKIYIGTDADIFVNVISMGVMSLIYIRRSLAEDGIIINDYVFDNLNNNTPLDLKHICYLKFISLYKEGEEFKSLDPYVHSIGSINSYVGKALMNQRIFDKSMVVTFSEKSQSWDEALLKNFEIDLNKIDLLYYIRSRTYMDKDYYELIYRMKYPESFFLYVKLVASCCICKKGFACSGEGKIFVIRDDSSVFTMVENARKKITTHTTIPL